jgi:hypothetical protein
MFSGDERPRAPLGSAVIAALAAFVAASAPFHARAQCTKDADCKGDRICVQGECRQPVGAPAPGKSSRWGTDRDLLLIELADAKTARTRGLVTLGIGYGVGAASMIAGGIVFAKVESKTASTVLLVQGAIDLLMGIVGTICYAVYDGDVAELEKRLGLLPGGGSGNSGLSFPETLAGFKG